MGVLAENGENASGEYKLTLQDSEREFELEESALVGYKGEKVKFRYKGAKFGDNEYISAMILDDNKVVTYYGQVEKSAEKSDVTVDVKAEKWQDGDAMTIFTVAITDLNVSNYNRNFTAKAYAKVRYYNGEMAKIYGAKSVTRSIYAVSSGLLKNQATDDERLYSVLNAYVNMVGVRLKMDKSGNVSRMKTGEGAYSGDVFFSVTSTDNGDGVYTVTVTPLKSFKNKVTIMGYRKEFVRINNNNSVVKDCISNVTENEDGGITFTFTPPKN